MSISELVKCIIKRPLVTALMTSLTAGPWESIHKSPKLSTHKVIQMAVVEWRLEEIICLEQTTQFPLVESLAYPSLTLMTEIVLCIAQLGNHLHLQWKEHSPLWKALGSSLLVPLEYIQQGLELLLWHKNSFWQILRRTQTSTPVLFRLSLDISALQKPVTIDSTSTVTINVNLTLARLLMTLPMRLTQLIVRMWPMLTVIWVGERMLCPIKSTQTSQFQTGLLLRLAATIQSKDITLKEVAATISQLDSNKRTQTLLAIRMLTHRYKDLMSLLMQPLRSGNLSFFTLMEETTISHLLTQPKQTTMCIRPLKFQLLVQRLNLRLQLRTTSVDMAQESLWPEQATTSQVKKLMTLAQHSCSTTKYSLPS